MRCHKGESENNKKNSEENRGKDFMGMHGIVSGLYFPLECQTKLVNWFSVYERWIGEEEKYSTECENKQINWRGKRWFLMIQYFYVWFLLKIYSLQFFSIQNTLRLRIRAKLDLKLLVE